MNSLKVSLLVLSLLFAMPASAFLSYLNPFAWFRAAQKSYYQRKIHRAQKELERLRDIQIEVSSLEKIYSNLDNYEKKIQIAGKSLKGFMEIKTLLHDYFKKKQQQWGFVSGIYYANEIGIFKQHILAQALEKAEKENESLKEECIKLGLSKVEIKKENHVASKPLPKSWYDQLKDQERALTDKQCAELIAG